MNNKFFEWAGVVTAILYSMFVALNIGIEFFGFCLLLLSAICCVGDVIPSNALLLQIEGAPARQMYFASLA